MVLGKLLPSNEQGITPLLANEDDRDFFSFFVDVDQDPVLAQESELSLGDRIRSQSLYVLRVGQRVEYRERNSQPGIPAARERRVKSYSLAT